MKAALTRRLLVAGLFAFLAMPAEASPLDGKTFQGQIYDENGVARSKDEVSFRQGKFYSNTCAQWGFSGVPYWTRAEGEAIHFLVEASNPENGKMLFKGIVRGDSVEWTGFWTRERWYWTIRREIGFRGEAKR